MDESNQDGNAMKHFRTVALKNKKNIPSLYEFNVILTTLSHTNKIGHSFIVDIKFHVK